MVDEARFERAWRAYGGSLLRYCRFAAGSREVGEELAAETFARFLDAGERVAEDRVEAWLFKVARNLCTSHHRREGRWARLLPTLGRGVRLSEELRTDSDAIAMLRPLGDADRLAIYLRVVEDRSFAETARVLGVSEDAAKKRVRRALKRLRDSLDPLPGPSHIGGVDNV